MTNSQPPEDSNDLSGAVQALNSESLTVTAENVAAYSALFRLGLSGEEASLLRDQIAQLLADIEQLWSIDVGGEEIGAIFPLEV